MRTAEPQRDTLSRPDAGLGAAPAWTGGSGHGSDAGSIEATAALLGWTEGDGTSET